MTPNEFIYEIVEHEPRGCNKTFTLMTRDGFVGDFRITYYDETRKNARSKSFRASEVYIEKIELSQRAEYTVSAILYVQFNAQWLLEQLTFKSSALPQIKHYESE